MNLYLNVTRKHIPIGSKHEAFITQNINLESQEKEEVNKWRVNFKEVTKAMAYLCYDAKVHPKTTDGKIKNYTVCYEDRFHGVVETEVWRFHQEMDCPSHRVRMLKLNDKVIWDREKKFSLI